MAASNHNGSASEPAAWALLPWMCWNNTEDDCSSVTALNGSHSFVRLSKYMHFTSWEVEGFRPLIPIYASKLILSSCSQVCSQTFGGSEMKLIPCRFLNHSKWSLKFLFSEIVFIGPIQDSSWRWILLKDFSVKRQCCGIKFGIFWNRKEWDFYRSVLFQIIWSWVD